MFVVQNTAEFANTVGSVCFPGIDVELVGIEVVQVVQDLRNSVPLMEGKATLVRAYVQPVNQTQVGSVQVRGWGCIAKALQRRESPKNIFIL